MHTIPQVNGSIFVNVMFLICMNVLTYSFYYHSLLTVKAELCVPFTKYLMNHGLDFK